MKGVFEIMSMHMETKTMCTACILMLVLLMGAGCGQSPDELFAQGKELIQVEETFDQGIEMLTKFIQKHPDDPRSAEVTLALATAHQSRKQYDEAIETYTALIENHPSSNEACKALFLLGYMYYDDMDDVSNARSTLNRFIQTYPDSELTVSAKVLIENLETPVDEWPMVKELEKQQSLPE